MPDVAKNEIDIRINNCKEEIIANPSVPIPSIFESTIKAIQDDTLDMVAATPDFRKVKSTLYNCRNKAAGSSKMFFKNYEEVEVPLVYNNFLIADYYNNGDRIMVFGNEWSMDLLINYKNIFLDGTFAVCPEPFTQLVTIHCDIGSTTLYTNIFPILYVLLPNKNTDTYRIMFQLIKSKVRQLTDQDWDPAYIMVDFEAAIAKALSSEFPRAKKGGCFYHFHKSIWKKGKQFKLTSNRDKKRILQLTASLPLLPEEKIDEGWAYVESQILEDFKMGKFVNYFKKFWLKNREFRKQWSVFGRKHRTNNFAEAWHFKINVKNNRKISLFTLLKTLSKHTTGQKNRYKALVNDLKAPTPRQKEYVLRDYVIQNAQMQLVTGEITVGHFLDMLR